MPYEIGETILQSMDTLINARLKNINFDSTILCTVIDATEASSGKYKVSNGSASFTAYSTNKKYKVKDSVYVTILNNDYSNKKIIIDKDISEEDESVQSTGWVNLESTMLIQDFYKNFQTATNSLEITLIPNDSQLSQQNFITYDQNHFGEDVETIVMNQLALLNSSSPEKKRQMAELSPGSLYYLLGPFNARKNISDQLAISIGDSGYALSTLENDLEALNEDPPQVKYGYYTNYAENTEPEYLKGGQKIKTPKHSITLTKYNRLGIKATFNVNFGATTINNSSDILSGSYGLSCQLLFSDFSLSSPMHLTSADILGNKYELNNQSCATVFNISEYQLENKIVIGAVVTAYQNNDFIKNDQSRVIKDNENTIKISNIELLFGIDISNIIQDKAQITTNNSQLFYPVSTNNNLDYSTTLNLSWVHVMNNKGITFTNFNQFNNNTFNFEIYWYRYTNKSFNLHEDLYEEEKWKCCNLINDNDETIIINTFNLPIGELDKTHSFEKFKVKIYELKTTVQENDQGESVSITTPELLCESNELVLQQDTSLTLSKNMSDLQTNLIEVINSDINVKTSELESNLQNQIDAFPTTIAEIFCGDTEIKTDAYNGVFAVYNNNNTIIDSSLTTQKRYLFPKAKKQYQKVQTNETISENITENIKSVTWTIPEDSLITPLLINNAGQVTEIAADLTRPEGDANAKYIKDLINNDTYIVQQLLDSYDYEEGKTPNVFGFKVIYNAIEENTLTLKDCYLPYYISYYYDYGTNNIIELEIKTTNGEIYYGQRTLEFLQAGTSGSDYIITTKLYSDSEGSQITNGIYIQDNNFITDTNNKLLYIVPQFFEKTENKIKLLNSLSGITITYKILNDNLQFYTCNQITNTLNATIQISNEIGQDNNNNKYIPLPIGLSEKLFDTYKQQYSTIFKKNQSAGTFYGIQNYEENTQFYISCTNNDFISQCQRVSLIIEMTISGLQAEEKTITKYIAIPIIQKLTDELGSKTITPFLQGPTEIHYNTRGLLETVLDTPFILKDDDNNIINNIYWELIPSETSNIFFNKQFLLLNNNRLDPSQIYYKVNYNYAVIAKRINGNVEEILYTQPILILLDQYPSGILNAWTGSLQIDEENNRILSASIAAGTKNEQNQFSGIIMGDWTQDASSLLSEAGLYGFQDGKNTFYLKENGDGYLNGKIEAQEGLIGGWEISRTRLASPTQNNQEPSTIIAGNESDSQECYNIITNGIALKANAPNDNASYIELKFITTTLLLVEPDKQSLKYVKYSGNAESLLTPGEVVIYTKNNNNEYIESFTFDHLFYGFYEPVIIESAQDYMNKFDYSAEDRKPYFYCITPGNYLRYDYTKPNEITPSDLSDLYNAKIGHYFQEQSINWQRNYIYFKKNSVRSYWKIIYILNGNGTIKKIEFEKLTNPLYVQETAGQHGLSGILGYVQGMSRIEGQSAATDNLGLRITSDNTSLLLESTGSGSNLRMSVKNDIYIDAGHSFDFGTIGAANLILHADGKLQLQSGGNYAGITPESNSSSVTDNQLAIRSSNGIYIDSYFAFNGINSTRTGSRITLTRQNGNNGMWLTAPGNNGFITITIGSQSLILTETKLQTLIGLLN